MSSTTRVDLIGQMSLDQCRTWMSYDEGIVLLKTRAPGVCVVHVRIEGEKVWPRTFTIRVVRRVCPVCGCFIRSCRKVSIGKFDPISIRYKHSCINQLCHEYQASGSGISYEEWCLAKNSGDKIKESEYPELAKFKFLDECEVDWLDRDVRRAKIALSEMLQG